MASKGSRRFASGDGPGRDTDQPRARCPIGTSTFHTTITQIARPQRQPNTRSRTSCAHPHDNVTPAPPCP
jgi:hypothetical protein